ncbi:coiled-coil domain-containing protein 170-like [Biomphalaria glabrata]|uniref:Coiled-coil domain-containing protein 170-like n=1 Tax=Biomphalaria glabrata TaxID=6526 RepID=A0A9U8DZA3_BIOGL|nr:coiled-coil domain-containing protein 170-like [Biomphalaria glabrata]
MSYINSGKDTNGLPAINSARRIKILEDELQWFKMRESAGSGISGRVTPVGILKYDNKYDGSETRRQINELQDQVRNFREELKKKDNLIQHLVSLESAPKVPRAPDSYRLDSLYLGERSAVDMTRSELAAVQVKLDRAQAQIADFQREMESRDIKIKELQHLLDSSRETENRLGSMVASLRDKLAEYESRAGSYETVANRGEFTISTLQRENRELSDKIVDLEQRLRKKTEDHELAESKLVTEGRRHNELLSQISSLLYTEDLTDPYGPSVDIVIRKLNDIIQENAMLKGKIMTMNEHLNETQLETKASRETIMRLVSEVGREQKHATRYTSDIENLRLERDNALAARRDLEREIDLLKERLDASHRALEATKNELQLKENRFSSLDRDLREKTHNVRSASTQFDLFREQLANLLSSADINVVPSEENVKESVRHLVTDRKELTLRLDEYENRVKHLTEQLDNELTIHRDMAQRCKRFEVEAADLAERLRSAEAELAAGDCLRDGFKFDKEKYLRGLQKLGEIMKMDRISLDLGLDLTMDALIARAEQLMKLEADALADKTSHVYNLQRKIKALKEQLESKDLHIDLLRKKMTNLEERMHGRIDIEKQRESESIRVQKLEKLVEKYKLQLQDSRHEVQNLKAQLLGSSELKVRTLEQRKDIEELAKQIEELEEIRKRQSRKISELKSTVDNTETTFQEKKVASENAVQALSSELRTTKNALDTLKYREKQLVDFRTVVARMLGLDINTLAVPDYEIITRLEKLIQAHHATTFSTLSLEDALQGVHEGSAPLFHNTIDATDPVIARSRERSRRKAAKLRTRARSVSPMRRDPRIY